MAPDRPPTFNPYRPPAVDEAALPDPRRVFLDAEYPYRPLEGLVAFIAAALGAWVLLNVVHIVFDVMQIDLLHRIETGNYTQDEVNINDLRVGAAQVLELVCYVTAAVGFCLFLPRANRNARSLGARRLEFSPRWTVGSFFVPIMNLYRPYRAVRELWLASDPDGSISPRLSSPSPVVGLWWASWLIMNFSSYLVMRSDYKGASATALINMSQVDIGVSLIGLPSAGLAFLVVRGLATRLERRRRSIAAAPPAAAAESTMP
jgi:hypothetical protein